MKKIYNDENKEEFIAWEDGLEKGKLAYSVNNNVISLNSTYVDPKYRSEGLARDLVQASVDYARENKYKIKPICSYTVKVVDEIARELVVN